MDISLETLDFKHAARIQEMAADPAISATTTIPYPYPADGAKTFIAKKIEDRKADREQTFAILQRGSLVGVCGLMKTAETATAMVGYWVGKPYWGKGFASAGVRLLVNFGFRDWGLACQASHCMLTNRASFQVLENVGFHLIGVRTQIPGKWAPSTPIAFFEQSRELWHAGAGI